LGKGGQFERMNKIQDPLKIVLKNGDNMEKFVEDFREKLFSPAGIAVEAILTTVGFTAPAVVVSYGALLWYDVYKSSTTGKIDYWNIFYDILGIISSGALSAYLAPYLKSTKGVVFKSFSEVLTRLKTTNIWKILEPFLKKISQFIPTIEKYLSDGIKWIADNTKSPVFSKYLSQVSNFLKKITLSFAEDATEIWLLNNVKNNNTKSV